MTLDEAIRHCLEQARKLQDKADRVGDDESRQCMECAADHIQLAEWLMELKDLKAEQNDQYVFIHELMSELKEAKRLLKAAVDDVYNSVNDVHCKYCSKWHTDQCQDTSHLDCYIENKFKWRYADEALALIGKDIDVPATEGDTNVGRKSGGWISCKDRMPEVNEPVLFIFNTESGFKAVMYGWHETIKGLGSGWHQAGVGGARADEEVTYWQPLPEPPKDGEQNG